VNLRCPDPAAESALRLLASQALSRAAGAPLVPGNTVRVLRDAGEHYPVWLAAIEAAQRTVFFENYIFADDEVGREFVDALATKARCGVHVRVIYDWLGSFGVRHRLWRPLVEAGGEVRCFNPPHFASPLGWLVRDHRKMLAVDGRIGFVTGLCVSRKWLGDPDRGVAPWRDTGIEVRGPAVADIEQAFGQTWAAIGPPLAADELTPPAQITQAGDVALRVLAAVPNIAGLYRLDQLIAAMARERLWLTDAYFLGMAPYVQALRAAALDGVDVRLLVPGSSDLPLVSSLSRAGYRPLLEAGIRVFEWNGSMLHAKTAVADGRWARIGSSNLNVASWLGNYELDVAVEDRRFAAAMEQMHEEDIASATEIVLDAHRHVCTTGNRVHARPTRSGGSTARAAASALRIGNTVSAAITDRRVLGAAEAAIMIGAGFALLGLAIIGIVWPFALALPLALLSGWVAVALLLRGRELRAAGAASGRTELLMGRKPHAEDESRRVCRAGPDRTR
jgi:cardiolipin synthase